MITIKSFFKTISANRQNKVYIFFIVSKSGSVVFHDKHYYKSLDMAKAVGQIIRDRDFENCDVKTALVPLAKLDHYHYALK